MRHRAPIRCPSGEATYNWQCAGFGILYSLGLLHFDRKVVEEGHNGVFHIPTMGADLIRSKGRGLI